MTRGGRQHHTAPLWCTAQTAPRTQELPFSELLNRYAGDGQAGVPFHRVAYFREGRTRLW